MHLGKRQVNCCELSADGANIVMDRRTSKRIKARSIVNYQVRPMSCRDKYTQKSLRSPSVRAERPSDWNIAGRDELDRFAVGNVRIRG